MNLSTEETRKITGEEMAKLFCDWLNYSMGNSPSKNFMQKIFQTHRTLQQSLISFFWRTLLEYAKLYADNDWFDGRNEASVMLCRKLTKLVEDGTLPSYLPFI